jgi:hypothetical protein
MWVVLLVSVVAWVVGGPLSAIAAFLLTSLLFVAIGHTLAQRPTTSPRR